MSQRRKKGQSKREKEVKEISANDEYIRKLMSILLEELPTYEQVWFLQLPLQTSKANRKQA